MDFEHFKDKVFELLNEADNTGIIDIETFDKENIFKIFFFNGKTCEIEFRQVTH